jgi:hypothetical protein
VFRNKVLWAVLITYLVLSLVPQLGLMSMIGKKKPSGGPGGM